MATYKNRKNEQVEVTKEHLDTSVRIKLELQKASPSGRCSWGTHKYLMMKEGFDDSDTNENYRVLVKDYQRQQGLLPSNAKYANFIADKKLKSLEDMVGELYTAKRECSQEHKELNKTKREIVDELGVVNSIIGELGKIKFEFRDEITPKCYSDDDLIAVVTPSDWHIGLRNDEYNCDTAKSRIVSFAYEVLEMCDTLRVSDVYVCNLGDIINNVYMHKNTQAYNSDMTMAEQIVKAVELMNMFLDILARQLNVTYLGTVNGNHGRMSTKGETLTGDSAEYIVHKMICSIIEERIKQGYNNLHVLDDCYYNDYVFCTIDDKNFLFVHGDKESSKGTDVIKKYSSIIGEQIDYVFKGHTHNFKIESENYNRKIITCGCLTGSDDYAKSLGYYCNPSQNMVIIGKSEFIPIDIQL